MTDTAARPIKCFGFAVRAKHGGILIRTVYPTKRGAMINYLIAHQNIFVCQHATDDEIKRAFEKTSGVHGDSMIRVIVKEDAS